MEVRAFSTRELLRGSWDVWHLHWPEYIVNRRYLHDIIRPLLTFWIKLRLARFKRTKIFWTAHNLGPHERNHPLLERIFWGIFLPNVDGIICMSELGRQQLCIEHPRVRFIPTFVIPHGHYRGVYPDVISKEEARRALRVPSDEFVATFLGQIRAYKGVVPLIRCFAQAKIENAQLFVAGAPFDEGMMRGIKEAASLSRNVKLFPEFVNRNDVQKFLRAADLVILPYQEILNSGSGILALSFDRPILVPSLGALAELRESVGSDWVRLYEGELSPEVIRSAIHWVKTRQVAPEARAPLEELNWDRIAELTVRAFSFNATVHQSNRV